MKISGPFRAGVAAFVFWAALLPASAAAERTLVLQYEDPCPGLAARGAHQHVTVGGVNVSLESLYFGTCTYLRDQITESVTARVQSLKGEFNASAEQAANEVYTDFQHWLKEIVAARLGMDPNSEEFKPHFQEWLDHPDKEISFYVNAYLHDQYPKIHQLVERAQKDNSGEIIDGLKTLWSDAKDRYDRFTKAFQEIEANPNTPYADILFKYGFSGAWIDRFKGYEGRFAAFNNKYRLLEAAKVLYDAFEADGHRNKIAGMFTLLETIGDIAYRSDVPGVSLFGQIIKTYGELANKMLEQVNALENLIRAREGFCLGLATHTLEEKRNKAFIARFGQGIRVCPVSLQHPLYKNVYQQAQPENVNQLYFWIEAKGDFVKGQPAGGGMAGMRKAMELISEGAGIGFTELEGKNTDLTRIAAFYNTPYHHDTFGTGLGGLWSEAVATIDGIVSRLEGLGAGSGEACPGDGLDAELLQRCDLKVAHFPADGAQLHKLKLSFTLGYVAQRNPGALASRRSVAAHGRYKRAWRCVEPLSVLLLQVAVQESGKLGEPCPRCSGAEVAVAPSGGVQLPGCEVDRANARGEFFTAFLTESSELAVRLSAVVEGHASEIIVVDRRSVDMSPYPFVRMRERVTIPVRLDDGESEEEEVTAGTVPTPTPAPTWTPKPTTRVPRVDGMTLAEARSAIAGVGLKAEASGGDPAPSEHLSYRVAHQTPEGGAQVDPGSTVSIIIYDAYSLQDLVVPNVVGMPVVDALSVLREASLEGDVAEILPAPSEGLAQTVFSQFPLAGTPVDEYSKVSLRMYSHMGPSPTPQPTPTATPLPRPPTPTPARQAPPAGAGSEPGTPPVIVDGELPEPPNWDLAGDWDTTRGVIIRCSTTDGTNYSCKIVKVYLRDKYFHGRPGDLFLTAVKTGPNYYKPRVYVHMPNGTVQTMGGPVTVVNGDTAAAGRLTWRRQVEH